MREKREQRTKKKKNQSTYRSKEGIRSKKKKTTSKRVPNKKQVFHTSTIFMDIFGPNVACIGLGFSAK